MLLTTIEIPQQPGLDKVFEEQASTFKHARASYKLLKEKNKLVFKITADDSLAMRATTNSIFVTLNIYEKAKTI